MDNKQFHDFNASNYNMNSANQYIMVPKYNSYSKSRSPSPYIQRKDHFQFQQPYAIEYQSNDYSYKRYENPVLKDSFSYSMRSSNRNGKSNYRHQSPYNNQYNNHYHQGQQTYRRSKSPTLSPADQYRKTIAEDNRRIVRKHPELIDWNGIKTIGIHHHFNIPKHINRKCAIRVFDCSTIKAAIECHSAHPKSKTCLLNFANSTKPGGGYLNGRSAQEECLCRQTLLYPTLQKSYMYDENKRNGSRPEASDIMIFSPNVMVIRNDDYDRIHPFPVDIISSPAVDNRSGNIYNCEQIMKNRIRKIIQTAAEANEEILILGAFGCGVFKNNPKATARIFYQVLVEEGFKKYFRLVIFPIYKDQNLYHIFKSILI